MEEHDHTRTRQAIGVLVGRFKTSRTESLGLFKALTQLSRTSKTFNNILDNFLVSLSCRCIQGGGCHFARSKLHGFIGTSNINKFLECADTILQTFHQSVYIHIFTKCLIDIVTKCDYDFLFKYLQYLKDKCVIKPRLHFCGPNPRPAGKFPGFKLADLIKALQIANESGWADKALLLFDHLVDFLLEEWRRGSNDTEQIRERISANIRLNFDGQLGNVIQQKDWFKPRLFVSYETLLAPKKVSLATLPSDVFSLPIEQQPWFCGDSPNTLDGAVCEALAVCFEGSKLVAVIGRRKFDFDTSCRALIDTRQVRFYLPNCGVIRNLHLYHFYRSLVQQDLETMKSIQETHHIKWSKITTQPNPFVELLCHTTVAPRADMAQYLFDIGVPPVLAWPSEPEPVLDVHVPLIERILSVGAKIHENLAIQLLQKISFMNTKQMQRLITASEAYEAASMTKKIVLFALFEFQPIYHKRFTEQKRELLEMYKKGNPDTDDTTNYLQRLPRELLNHVIDLTEEPMLFYDLTAMILRVGRHGVLNTDGLAANDHIRDSSHCIELILTESNSSVLRRRAMKNLLYYMPHSVIRREYKWIREHILSTICHVLRPGRKLRSYIMKHETSADILERFHQYWPPRDSSFVDLFKTKNISALRFYLQRDLFQTPSRQAFEAEMKRPKYTMDYEEALALIRDVRAHL